MSFFMCQPKPLEEPPNRAGINGNATLSQQACRHFIERSLAFGIHLRAHPILVWRQFPDARIALTFRLKRSGLALQPDHIVDEFDRHIKTRRS